MAKTALVIEDDSAAAAQVQEQLRDLGISSKVVNDGAEGLAAALSSNWSLVIVDLHLPNLGGLEICRQVREANPAQPILVLTANPEQMISVLALELGADEFIRKPFHSLEIRARIRALLRRADLGSAPPSGEPTSVAAPPALPDTGQSLTFGDLVIDGSLYRVTYRGSQISLTPTEFELLFLLAQQNTRVFSREDIVSSLWEASPEVYSLNIRFHIKNLRTKFKDAGIDEPVIETERGFGYRFVYSVSP